MRPSFRPLAVTCLLALALPVAVLLVPAQAEPTRYTLPMLVAKQDIQPTAIALLREAKGRITDEVPANQREYLLSQVAAWLNYAGDSETAIQALTKAREIIRSNPAALAEYGRIHRIAVLMADCGDTRTAIETARMATSEQERESSLYEVAVSLANGDRRSGAWEALTTIRNDANRQIAIRRICESALRARDFPDFHRAIAQMPPDQRAWFAEEMANRLESQGYISEAKEVRDRYPFSAEQKKAKDALFTKFFQGLYSGKIVDIAEAERMAKIQPAGIHREAMLVTAGENLYRNGRKKEALRYWKELASRIEGRLRILPGTTMDLPGDTVGQVPVSREDIRTSAVAYDLAYCSIYLYRTPEGANFFLDRALRRMESIQTPGLHTQTMNTIISYCLNRNDTERALAGARQIRQPEALAWKLAHIAREQIWIADRKKALATLLDAERVVERLPELRSRIPLFCQIAVVRKRAGDLPGARRVVERAVGNYNEIEGWQKGGLETSLVQALSEAEQYAQARTLVTGIKEPATGVRALIHMASAYLPDERPYRRAGPHLP